MEENMTGGCELALTRCRKRRCIGIYGSVHSSTRRLESCRGRRFDQDQTSRRPQSSSSVGRCPEKSPRELVDNVHDQLVSNIIAANKDAVKSQDLSPEIKKVESQLNELCRYIAKANKHFWPALLDFGRDLTAKPAYYSRGDEREMQLYLAYSYGAWKETRSAIGVIREKTNNKL